MINASIIVASVVNLSCVSKGRILVTANKYVQTATVCTNCTQFWLCRVPSESDPGSEDISGATRKEAKKGRRPAAASKKSKKRKVRAPFCYAVLAITVLCMLGFIRHGTVNLPIIIKKQLSLLKPAESSAYVSCG